MVNNARIAKAIGVGILSFFFILFVLMVLVPSDASMYFEIIVRTAWLLSVVGVYWLFGQVLGPEGDFGKLVACIGMLALLIPAAWIVCGAGFFAELLIGYAWDGLSGATLKVGESRLERRIENDQLATRLYVNGLWRGANF